MHYRWLFGLNRRLRDSLPLTYLNGNFLLTENLNNHTVLEEKEGKTLHHSLLIIKISLRYTKVSCYFVLYASLEKNNKKFLQENKLISKTATKNASNNLDTDKNT